MASREPQRARALPRALALLLLVVALASGALGLSRSATFAQLPQSNVVELGESVEGRPIVAYRLGDLSSLRKALVVGIIHGDERQGIRIARELRADFQGISGVDLWVIDAVNPDGAHAHKRQNAHGVDLNRNFPYQWKPGKPRSRYYPGPAPFSEPESQIVRDLVSQLKPAVSIWYHQPWNAVLRPCRGAAPIQKRYARLAQMKTSCRGHGLHGTAINWENSTFGGTAMVVELPAKRLGAKAVARNAGAVAAVAAS